MLGLALDEGYAYLTPFKWEGESTVYQSVLLPQEAQSYKHNPYRTAVLQMLLLYDTVKVVTPQSPLRYDPLVATGRVEVITGWQEPLLFGQPPAVPGMDYAEWDEATKAYAGSLLKPIIIDALVRNGKVFSRLSPDERAVLRSHQIGRERFYSDLFDFILLGVPEDQFSWVREFRRAAEVEGYRRWQGFQQEQEELRYVNPLSSMGVTSWFWEQEIQATVGELIALLEMSNLGRAVLLQRKYRFIGSQAAHLVWEEMSNTQLLESFGVLRASLAELIGQLPAPRSIDEVLRLKEGRMGDVHHLRSVLWGVEQALKEGRPAAFAKAAQEVQRASAELSFGTRAARVGKWMTYLALPVSRLEAAMGLPSVSGVVFGIVGPIVQMADGIARARNGWLNLLR